MKIYMRSLAELSVTTSQTSIHAASAVTDNPSPVFPDTGNVTQYVTCKPAASAGCDGVTDKTPGEAAIVYLLELPR